VNIMRKLLIVTLLALAPVASALAQGSVPWHQGSVPWHQGSVPWHQGSVPWHQGSVPWHQGSVPWHQGSVPWHQGSVPWHQSGAGNTSQQPAIEVQSATPAWAEPLGLLAGLLAFGGIVAFARRRLQK
jgi:hypothetical protein